MVLAQSAFTRTLIGLNKKTQNRLQPVPSGTSLLFLLCWHTWKHSTDSTLDASHAESTYSVCIHERKAGRPGKNWSAEEEYKIQEQNTNRGLKAEPNAYERLIYFLLLSLREEFAALGKAPVHRRNISIPLWQIWWTCYPFLEILSCHRNIF